MFKNHLEMIGRNEPVSKKAKFWQSYVRSLKGSDDIRAPEGTRSPRSIFRPMSDFPELHSTTWPYGKSIYDDPLHASDRINTPGYRYLPIHRETYGYSPRAIYPHQYTSSYRPIYRVPYRERTPIESEKAWQDHLDRLDSCRLYPSRWPLYLRYHSPGPFSRALDEKPYDPHRAWQDHLDRLAEIDKLYPSQTPLSWRHTSPIKAGFLPSTDVAYNYAGLPIYSRGGLPTKLWDMLNPSPSLPKSAITRDPWWWDLPSLKPVHPKYDSWGKSPFYLRDSYLSPVKRTYLWDKHPIRPLGELPRKAGSFLILRQTFNYPNVHTATDARRCHMFIRNRSCFLRGFRGRDTRSI